MAFSRGENINWPQMNADERGYVYTERKKEKDKLAAIFKSAFLFYLRSSAAESGLCILWFILTVP
jgi:hypothetical protein